MDVLLKVAEVLLAVGGIVFAFALVIFVHEFGHFIVAKKTGVKVEQFSFGFGKEIFGFQRGETRYSVNWIPLGGFVKMAGEMAEDYAGPALEGKPAEKSGGATDRSREFMGFPWYRRIPIVVAGPVMNYVLAVVIFFFTLLTWGLQVATEKPIVGDIIQGYPAALAGMKSGDEVLAVNGEKVKDFTALAQKIHSLPDVETELMILRDGREMALKVVPRKVSEQGGKGFIGITPAMQKKKMGVIDSFTGAVRACYNISALTVTELARAIWKREKVDVAGPIGIGQVIVKAVKLGWEDFFRLIGLLSVAIGLFNLFPVPMLDGGHLAYFVIEGIRGKPLSTKTISRANYVGFVLIIALVLYATTNDVKRLWPSPNKPAPAQVQ